MDSLLGLSVTITVNRSHFELTVFNEHSGPEDIRASLLVPISTVDPTATPATVVLIAYAATPGAFIDLAADLSWLTGRTLSDFRLDEHRTLPSSYAKSNLVAETSSINQALGVLIGCGSTPEEAERELDARAVSAGIDLLGAATPILDASPHPLPLETARDDGSCRLAIPVALATLRRLRAVNVVLRGASYWQASGHALGISVPNAANSVP